ncbi:hypothetical protein M0R45_009245 [Rubus argutus]|uniref:DYW domain-containing protein n=1 Tax=Rubus argutus TaxID=59490 RepID=A0AAW1Y3X5_RUBAR
MANLELLLKKCESLTHIKQLQAHLVSDGRFQFYPSITIKLLELCALPPIANIPYATTVFHQLRNPSTRHWNAVVRGLAQSLQPAQAISWYKNMSRASQKVDAVTCSFALKHVHAHWRSLRLCRFILRCLRYDMWKNLVTWNTMVMAFAMHGDGYKALELFEKMGENGVCPDAVSYLAALCACNHAGLVEDGVKLFYSMASSGMVPNVKHYGTVVDLLGRAGRLQEAYEIVKSMPMFPDVVLWQTLLGASKTYGNVDMAEMASQKLVELGSEGCGDFVLLSNVYAAHKRWDDVGRLDEIKFRIKAYGYVAKTNHVLHDIGEEDKENALSYHFYNREIIVRDRARFHRFKEGFCSCRDYW